MLVRVLKWLLRWKPLEFRITRVPGDIQGLAPAVYYIEGRGGWRRRWERISWTRPGGVKRGHFKSDGYSSYEAADVARLELLAYYGESEDLVVSGPEPPPEAPKPTPPPEDPPDLRVHFTEARTRALKDSVAQVLTDAMVSLDRLNRFAWDGEAIWAPSNRPEVASILAHCAAAQEALLVIVRDVETELAVRRKIPQPAVVAAPVSRRPPKPPRPLDTMVFTSAAGYVDEATTAPPYTPLQALRDAGAAKSAVLHLEKPDEPPTEQPLHPRPVESGRGLRSSETREAEEPAGGGEASGESEAPPVSEDESTP